jgi:hypothetical protein
MGEWQEDGVDDLDERSAADHPFPRLAATALASQPLAVEQVPTGQLRPAERSSSVKA